jgi:hypothetical protein
VDVDMCEWVEEDSVWTDDGDVDVEVVVEVEAVEERRASSCASVVDAPREVVDIGGGWGRSRCATGCMWGWAGEGSKATSMTLSAAAGRQPLANAGRGVDSKPSRSIEKASRSSVLSSEKNSSSSSSSSSSSKSLS